MEVFEGLNWGIIKKIKVITFNNITFPLFQNQIDFADISIQNGQNFEEIPFIFESAGFREVEERTSSGMKWKKEVVLRIPKLRVEVSLLLDKYSGRKLTLLTTDMNNESQLVFPMRMTRQRNIPGQAASLNATEVTFTGEYTNASPFVLNVP